MRGSLKTQITAALKCCCRFGVSRHVQKLEHGGQSPYIHSIGSFDRVAHRLWPLALWLEAKGILDIELLDEVLVSEYLPMRLEHHIEKGHARKTFQCELSALGNLERGLTLFSALHRVPAVIYDFSKPRKQYGKSTKILPTASNPYASRAIPNPYAAIEVMDYWHYRIMAKLQVECGCRAIGVGAPARMMPGVNAVTMDNFLFDGQTEPQVVVDPITLQKGFYMWTKEKGGKVAVKFCPLELAQELFAYIRQYTDGLKGYYMDYLASLNKALIKTGQAAKGRGTHSLRFCFAQRRYLECIKSGMGDEEAKQWVSAEMSHKRAKITEAYLK